MSCLFAVRNMGNSGNILMALQMVFINEDGTKREQNGIRKRTWGVYSNWSDRGLFKASPSMKRPIIAEGPETALAIANAVEFERGVFATMGVSNLIKASIPRNRRPVIAADGDDPGSQAYRQAENAAAQLRGKVIRAPLGKDFADMEQATVRRIFR